MSCFEIRMNGNMENKMFQDTQLVHKSIQNK